MPLHGGGPEEGLRRTTDHSGFHWPQQMYAMSCLSHPSCKGVRRQHPARHVVFYHVGLSVQLLAGPLHEESSKLTTFITPWGAFCVDNVWKVVEDVLIYDVYWATHVQRVRDVLRRCAENGITLRLGKFVLGAPAVGYCGLRLFGCGYTVDDHLVKALTHFPVPVNRTDIRSFCILVQQFQSFSPRLTKLLAPSEHSCHQSPSSPGRPLTKSRSSKSSANWPALAFW